MVEYLSLIRTITNQWMVSNHWLRTVSMASSIKFAQTMLKWNWIVTANQILNFENKKRQQQQREYINIFRVCPCRLHKLVNEKNGNAEMFSHKQIYEYISLSFDWISKIYSNGCLSENLCQKKCSAKAWRVRSIQLRKKMRLSFQWQAKIEKEWVLLTFRERMKFTYFLFTINKKMEKLLSDCRSIMKTKKKREKKRRGQSIPIWIPSSNVRAFLLTLSAYVSDYHF